MNKSYPDKLNPSSMVNWWVFIPGGSPNIPGHDHYGKVTRTVRNGNSASLANRIEIKCYHPTCFVSELVGARHVLSPYRVHIMPQTFTNKENGE